MEFPNPSLDRPVSFSVACGYNAHKNGSAPKILGGPPVRFPCTIVSFSTNMSGLSISNSSVPPLDAFNLGGIWVETLFYGEWSSA